MGTLSKVCPMCHRRLSLDHFYPNRGRSDGRATYCKPCYRDKTNYNRALKREGKEQAWLTKGRAPSMI